MSSLHVWYMVVLTATAVTCVQGAITLPGLQLRANTKILKFCPPLPMITNFNKATFDGVYYVYQQYNNPIEVGFRCSSLDYSKTSDVFTYSFKASNGKPYKYSGTYTASTAATMPVGVRLPYMFALGADIFGNVNQYVADLKPDYAIVRSCTNFGIYHEEYAYVLTRSRLPTEAVKHAISGAIKQAGMFPELLITIDQTSC